jgi:glutathionylspermidine synthase
MRSLVPPLDYPAYDRAWQRVAHAGARDLNLDVWAGGWRYLSLAALALSPHEASALRRLTNAFPALVDLAVQNILEDAEWWSSLAWPWPAIELARQEPPHPGGVASLYGRFDFLIDQNGYWQLIEYNADTPSGGREASGLEPGIARLFRGCARPSIGFRRRLVRTLQRRIAQHDGCVRRVGIISSHSWLEDFCQAVWLSRLLCRAGQSTVVGDVTDLHVDDNHVTLRGLPIDALYRFYPIERLYRHAVFAPLWEAAIEGRILLLNGLRGFLAQSKACLAWLWTNRQRLPPASRALVEAHLPPTVLARDADPKLLRESVVKHVNGREGDSVVFGSKLEEEAWQARLLEGGYVVQRAVASPRLEDVSVDDWNRTVRRIAERFACVGAFTLGGRFGGCYTRLDGAITSSRATYVATLIERWP